MNEIEPIKKYIYKYGNGIKDNKYLFITELVVSTLIGYATAQIYRSSKIGAVTSLISFLFCENIRNFLLTNDTNSKVTANKEKTDSKVTANNEKTDSKKETKTNNNNLTTKNNNQNKTIPKLGVKGIQNNGQNNCFMNSLLQFIYHTPLKKFFLDERNFMPRGKQFHAALTKFFNQCADPNQKSLDSEHFRKFFKFPSGTQQDPGEVLASIFNMCRNGSSNSIASIFGELKSIDLSEKKEDKEKRSDLSTVKKDGVLIKKAYEIPIQLPIPRTQKPITTVIDCINLKCDISKQNADYSYMHRGKQYSNNGFLEATNPVKLNEHVYLQFKRFQYDLQTNQTIKINTLITFLKKGVVVVGREIYRLRGVIVHRGSTANSGHYFAYLKVGKIWLEFNDRLVEQRTSEQVLKNAKDVYILYLQRVSI